MTNLPKITVLIPVYNGEKYIQDSLNSIKNQTFTDFEILVIDDGSTDGSLNILNRTACLDSRFRVIGKSNTGLTDTLNFGIAQSRGEWIARMDQDDVASCNRLELQNKRIQSNRNLVLLGSNFITRNERTLQTSKYRLPQTHRDLVGRLERLKGFFPHSSAFFHKETVREIGGYDPDATLNEDWDLWLRLSTIGEIGSVDKYLVTVRKHSAQMTANTGLIFPQAEAFVSTTIYFYHGRKESMEKSEREQRDNLSKRIRDSKYYIDYCQLIRFNQIAESVAETRKDKILLLIKTMRFVQILRLINYRLNGTNGPRATSRNII